MAGKLLRSLRGEGRVDVRAVVLAFGIHITLAAVMFLVPERDSSANTLVELEILENKPEPEEIDEIPPPDPDLLEEPEPEAPPPEPEPEPKPKPRAAPLAEPEPEPEPEPPAEPEPTYFGMLPDSTEGTGTVVVPIGDRLDVDPSITTDDPSKVGGKKFADRGAVDGTGTEKAPEPPKEDKPVSFALVTKPPKLKTEVRAKYPEEAKELGIEGTVIARLIIGADGRVKKVKVLGGPGHGLEEEAVKALMSFVFEPATLDGKPVSTVIPRYEYEFVLD